MWSVSVFVSGPTNGSAGFGLALGSALETGLDWCDGVFFVRGRVCGYAYLCIYLYMYVCMCLCMCIGMDEIPRVSGNAQGWH